MRATGSIARAPMALDDARVPRARPGGKTGGFRSQLAAVREPKRSPEPEPKCESESRVRGRHRDRDEQAPKRRRYEDDDDVVVWEQPAQPQRAMESRKTGELQQASSVLAGGSGQIARPAGMTSGDATTVATGQSASRPVAPEPSLAEAPPLTPLEQAVQELIAKLEGDSDEHDESPAPLADAVAIAPTGGKGPPPITSPKQLVDIAPARDVEAADAATASPTSHVHLVIGEAGEERTIVTVAVRGNDVHVALRGGDDAVTAALARNAGSLDHAMRARGLDLSEFTAEPDRRSAKQEHQEPERRDDQRAPRFSLEEHA